MVGNSKLFSFIFLTIKASANDPNSKNFLPTLLGNIGSGKSKLLPLTEDQWKIGKITGEGGASISNMIANSYSLYSTPQTFAIPYPKNPSPTIDLKDSSGKKKVVIEGLENVYITGFNKYQYDELTQTVTADVTMQFNYWTKNPKGLKSGQIITSLGLNTPFVLNQQLCKCKEVDSTTCLDPNSKTIAVLGEGTFTAEISQLNFAASIKINVQPNRAGLDLAITKLLLTTTGKDAPSFNNIKATLTNGNKFIGPIVGNLIQSFLSQPEASTAIFTQMQDSLNSDENISAISQTLQSQIGTFLNARLGPVTGPLPSDNGQSDGNKVDLYLFDRIRYSLNNPKSTWYVQTLLNSYKNPPLNPFKPESITIGSFEILEGFNLTDVTLTNIVITGFPNATAPSDTMILSPPTLNMAILLGSLGNGTSANADLSAKYSDGTQSLKFSLTITMKSVSIKAIVAPSGEDASKLDVKFNAIDISIPQQQNLNITLSDKGPFGPAIQKILNTKPIQDKITASVNAEFKKHLSAISTEVTGLIKDILNQQLGAG